MLLVQYPTCTTCKKAKKYLESHNISFDDRNIKEENPTAEELGLWQPKSGKDVKAFFNKLPAMSDEEKLALLATNGMLVKRPLLILDDEVLVGFKEAEWEAALKRKGYLK